MEEKEKKDRDQKEEQLIQNLLRLMGRRAAIPADLENRVKQDVRMHWKRQLRSRAQKRFFVFFASTIAASLLLVFAFHRFVAPTNIPVPVAIVENSQGLVTADNSQIEKGSALKTVLHAGALIQTDESGSVSLRLLNGVTLRINTSTELKVRSASEFVLEHGTIYIATNGVHRGLVISTSLGEVTNLGTRFEVRLNDTQMEIRVREGSVSLKNKGAAQIISGGNRVVIDRKGTLSRSEFRPFGSEWDWISRISPPFNLEGHTLMEFLDWITVENGWRLTFSEKSAEESQRGVVLHGSVSDMKPEQMLDAVLPVCNLSYTLKNGILMIKSSQEK